jgi:hypothetical protein
MKLPELHSAVVELHDGSQLNIINPKIELVKGQIILTGILNHSDFKNEADVQDKLKMKPGLQKKTIKDLFSIKGIESHASEFELYPVDISSIEYSQLKVKFVCYGYLEQKFNIKYDEPVPDVIYSIGVEGMKMAFEKVTTLKREREIFSKLDESTLSMKRDFSLGHLTFKYLKTDYDLKLSFIESSSSKIISINLEEDKLPLDVYEKIKFSMRGFFSFAAGNNLIFKRENFTKDGSDKIKIHSVRRVKARSYSDYIPINDIHFRHKNILRDYLECFDNYLFLDTHFSLTEVVFLFNQAKKSSIDTGIFIMLVTIEKLADKYISSIFYDGKSKFIIDRDLFNSKIKDTKLAFEKDFSDLSQTDYNTLFTKLGSINSKGKTDKKISDLLDFAQINKTEKIEKLFTTLRNSAIHEGDIGIEEGNAHSNYTELELLLNNIIANIIQYKGIRYLYMEENKNIISIETEYKTDYSQFRDKE